MMGLWVLVLVGVVVATVGWDASRREDRTDGALHVLDRRLAAGEVTVEEHAARRRVLLEEGGRGTPARSRSPLLVVALAGIVLVLVSAIAMGGLSSWTSGSGGWMRDHMGWSDTTGSTTTPIQGAPTVEVRAGDLWFRPATVDLVAGEPVNLQLDNTGAVFHDLTIPAADVVLTAEPGERASGGLELPEPGRYEFFCSVPGHARAGMRGTLVVATAAR